MSKGLGKLQREVLAILENKKGNADYRRLYENGIDRGLCNSKIPERWGKDELTLNKENPIENGWISIVILQALLNLKSRSSYKSLLRAIKELEIRGLIQTDLSYTLMVIGQQRKHVRLICSRSNDVNI